MTDPTPLAALLLTALDDEGVQLGVSRYEAIAARLTAAGVVYPSDAPAAPCAYCGSVNGETPSTAWHNDPLTGETLRAAIAVACDLHNPRLSEVDWDFVAAYWSIAIVRDYAETFGLTPSDAPAPLREAAEDVLKWWDAPGRYEQYLAAIDALRAALATPDPER